MKAAVDMGDETLIDLQLVADSTVLDLMLLSEAGREISVRPVASLCPTVLTHTMTVPTHKLTAHTH